VLSVALLSVVATASGTISGLLPLLQIARMIRARSAAGVSLGFLAGGVVNGTAWGAYGIALRNPAVVFSNSLWVLTGSAMFAVAAAYRRAASAGEPGAAIAVTAALGVQQP
jgi:uncharacterized protein with PQ loop repeat